MDSKRRGLAALAGFVAVGVLVAPPTQLSAQTARGAQAPEVFEAHLGPTPVPDGAPSPIRGEGRVRATLRGQTLAIEGDYALTATAATGATLMKGAGIGIPVSGSLLSTVDLTPARDGKLVGVIALNREQVVALRAGALYLQVNSAKSPAPVGHVWGWLLPAQPRVVQNEPQMGGWYLPQGAGLKASASPGKSK